MDVDKMLEEKRKAYNKQWYEKHKDEKKVYAHQHYLDNKETINKRNREWYQANKNAASKQTFLRQKDMLSVLSRHRKCIGDTTYYLLKEEIEQMEKHIFKV